VIRTLSELKMFMRIMKLLCQFMSMNHEIISISNDSFVNISTHRSFVIPFFHRGIIQDSYEYEIYKEHPTMIRIHEYI
jgi:hypothetical protein